jgi:ribosomal protein S18 acetylase RimI-like enzyme
MNIEYLTSADGITDDQLIGFFERWPNPPSRATHLRLLKGSYRVVLARESGSDRVIGFVTAISDGVLSAYIPLLEVLPEYRIHGVGRELLARMLELLKGFYMVDLVCDDRHRDGYASFGMRAGLAMTIRRFDRQSGQSPRE